MADNIEFVEDPLVFNDSSEVKRKSTQTPQDQVSQPKDSITTRATRTQSDAVTPPQDQVNIAQTQKPSIEDSVSMPNEDITTLKHSHDTGVPPRLDTTKIETEEQALDYFYNELMRRFRFNKYDNMIDAPTHKLEVEDALDDAVEEINEFIQPRTNWDLLYFVKKGRRYRRLLLLGAAKNVLQMLTSEWIANGVDVVIEDFQVDNKTSDTQGFYDAIREQFQEQLQQMKEYDRLTVKYSTFSTGKRRWGSGYNSLVARTTRIVRSGGIIH